MKKIRAALVAVMILVNGVVLLGQVMPEKAPPFARTVNIAFLSANLLWLAGSLFGKRD